MRTSIVFFIIYLLINNSCFAQNPSHENIVVVNAKTGKLIKKGFFCLSNNKFDINMDILNNCPNFFRVQIDSNGHFNRRKIYGQDSIWIELKGYSQIHIVNLKEGSYLSSHLPDTLHFIPYQNPLLNCSDRYNLGKKVQNKQEVYTINELKEVFKSNRLFHHLKMRIDENSKDIIIRTSALIEDKNGNNQNVYNCYYYENDHIYFILNL